MRLFLIVLLGVFAIQDLKSQSIPATWIWACLGGMLIYRLLIVYSGKSNVTELFFCILPGMVFLVLSHWGRQIGSGDGWLITISGLCLGWEQLLKSLTYAFLTVGLFGAGCLFWGHKEKSTRIPFVPFLFIGEIIPVVRDFL